MICLCLFYYKQFSLYAFEPCRGEIKRPITLRQGLGLLRESISAPFAVRSRGLSLIHALTLDSSDEFRGPNPARHRAPHPAGRRRIENPGGIAAQKVAFAG